MGGGAGEEDGFRKMGWGGGGVGGRVREGRGKEIGLGWGI